MNETPNTGGPTIDAVIPLRNVATDLGVNFYAVKGFALGRGMRVFKIDRAEVIGRDDYAVIKRDLPRALKGMRRSTSVA